jgi:hypothetical protein
MLALFEALAIRLHRYRWPLVIAGVGTMVAIHQAHVHGVLRAPPGSLGNALLVTLLSGASLCVFLAGIVAQFHPRHGELQVDPNDASWLRWLYVVIRWLVAILMLGACAVVLWYAVTIWLKQDR